MTDDIYMSLSKCQRATNMTHKIKTDTQIKTQTIGKKNL